LWSVRKNAHKGRAGALFWLLGKTVIENTKTITAKEKIFTMRF
jgi:hypothetical protein